MSIPYHKEIYNSDKIKLMVNFTSIQGDIADENLSLTVYAFDDTGTPIFNETLSIISIRELYHYLDSVSVIKNGTCKSQKFIEKTDDIKTILEILKVEDLTKILPILNNFSSQEKIDALINALSNLELENLQSAYKHKMRNEEIFNLEKLIELEMNGDILSTIGNYSNLVKYRAGQPEKIFQNWIESNIWIFGVEYIKKHDYRKIALFSECDILMESVDGYLDLIELKRPTSELLKFDKSHNCYYPHSELSQVIGQCLFYLQKLNEYKLNVEKEYEVKIIMPRIKILAGNNCNFNKDQLDCLRMLNTNLNSIQIVTYNDLILFGKLLLKENKQIFKDEI